ncbi:MAG: hypothetical protein HY558_00150 [Euryarchaeota archaeon]|nr:hypothetical protein [Euryarchaeota archaeon]
MAELAWDNPEAKKKVEEVAQESGFPLEMLIAMFNGLYRSDYVQAKIRDRPPDKALDYIIRTMKMDVKETKLGVPSHLWGRMAKEEKK